MIWFFLAAVVALCYLGIISSPASLVKSALKTTPLLLAAVGAGSIGAPNLVIVGLLLSAVGDLALSRTSDRAFLFGLGAFALAHVLYSLAIIKLDAIDLNQVGIIAVLFIAFSTEFWLRPYTKDLKFPVRIYVVLISIMMVAALSQPSAIVAIGAGLFVLSDCILAIRLFRMDAAHRFGGLADRGLWVAYVLGQIMIALGFGA